MNRRALLKVLRPFGIGKCPFANLPTSKKSPWGEGITAEEMGDYIWLTLWVVKLQTVTFTMVMSAGALAWAVGNICWWAGWPFNRVVPWWIAFLALTIVGERLDLSRFQKPSKAKSAPVV